MSFAAPTVSGERPESRRFTLRQRLAIRAISWAVWVVIRLIGPTLRIRISREEGGPREFVRPAVYVFWHRCVFPAAWLFRDLDIAVMTSSSFDGEYIARIIERFGFRAVRGSSTRGGMRALLGFHKEIEAGRSVAFTIDGPRGPMYVAKPGPVPLVRNVQKPLFAFHVALERAWVLKTWDRLMIPKPFSRGVLRVSRLFEVPPDAEVDALKQYHAEMQAALDRVREQAEAEIAAGG